MLKPINRHPLLVSDGMPKDLPARERATPHTYVDSKIDPDPEFGDLQPQWSHMFKCDVTGAVRQFGCEEIVLS